jgi:hypothetical protein
METLELAKDAKAAMKTAKDPAGGQGDKGRAPRTRLNAPTHPSTQSSRGHSPSSSQQASMEGGLSQRGSGSSHPPPRA